MKKKHVVLKIKDGAVLRDSADLQTTLDVIDYKYLLEFLAKKAFVPNYKYPEEAHIIYEYAPAGSNVRLTQTFSGEDAIRAYAPEFKIDPDNESATEAKLDSIYKILPETSAELTSRLKMSADIQLEIWL